jgi:hypothetical protein
MNAAGHTQFDTTPERAKHKPPIATVFNMWMNVNFNWLDVGAEEYSPMKRSGSMA